MPKLATEADDPGFSAPPELRQAAEPDRMPEPPPGPEPPAPPKLDEAKALHAGLGHAASGHAASGHAALGYAALGHAEPGHAEPGPATERSTVRHLLDDAAARFAASGIASPRQDARLLLAAALEVDQANLIARDSSGARGGEVSRGQAARFGDYVAMRLARRPVSRILARRGFHDLDLSIDDNVLDPRPESETLIGAIMAERRDGLLRAAPDAMRILDLGCGSGALILTLLCLEKESVGLGVDICPRALATSCRNGAITGVTSRVVWLQSNWCESLVKDRRTGGEVAAHEREANSGADHRPASGFHLIVSNPPYIRRGELATLEPEVQRYDPILALDGGPDGLDAYRGIAQQAPKHLEPGGLLAVEGGAGQADNVVRIFANVGFGSIRRSHASRYDLDARERCLVFTADRRR